MAISKDNPMKSSSNIDHLAKILLVSGAVAIVLKIFAFGPLGLFIVAACAIAAYAML
mgnify:CR=1 FL=1